MNKNSMGTGGGNSDGKINGLYDELRDGQQLSYLSLRRRRRLEEPQL